MNGFLRTMNEFTKIILEHEFSKPSQTGCITVTFVHSEKNDKSNGFLLPYFPIHQAF